MRALVNAKLAEAKTAWQKYCILRNVQYLPASPPAVAGFVIELAQAKLPIETIFPYVREISQEHILNGLADPCVGPVSAAIEALAPVDPPRSWPATEKSRFDQLPWDLKAYLAAREKDRDLTTRRLQNEAADAKRKLKLLEMTSVTAEEKPEGPARSVA